MRSVSHLATGMICLLLVSCVAPAFTTSQYEAKVVQTAESAAAAIESVRLTLDLMARHGLPKPPIDVAVSAQEDIIGSVVGTFSITQPPNQASINLRDELLALLDDAQSKIEEARIQLRRGNVNAAVAAIESAEDISTRLDALVTRLSG